MSQSDLVRQAMGLDESHLEMALDAPRLMPEVRAAFDRLASDARAAGFEPEVASAYRSFDRQRSIWNAKLAGERAVLDDADQPVPMSALSALEQIHAVLRFSALPGTSRHHWGTDLDVFDRSAMPEGYELQLCMAEVCEGGIFDDFHCWLDERIDSGESHGFFRPYDRDRGGVSPERWHLSYAPAAQAFENALSAAALVELWESLEESGEGLALAEAVRSQLDELLERYVFAVADAPASALGYRLTR